ncbi:MAG: hypothetical protein VR70_00535, partial [Rhodospirillaceae bacterium BRH_c57]
MTMDAGHIAAPESIVAFPEPCALIGAGDAVLAANRAFADAPGLLLNGALTPHLGDAVAALRAAGGGRARIVV